MQSSSDNLYFFFLGDLFMSCSVSLYAQCRRCCCFKCWSETLSPHQPEYLLWLSNCHNKLKQFLCWLLMSKMVVSLGSVNVCLCFSLTDSREEIPGVSGPTTPNMAEAGASTHPEGPPSQSNAIHRSQVRELDRHFNWTFLKLLLNQFLLINSNKQKKPV